MAKSVDIINQLIAIVPSVTNLFSDAIPISSLTFSGGLVTAVTSSPHGLSTGNYMNITGAQAPVVITSITNSNNVATAVTAIPHDLTEGYQTTVQVTGATQPEYNGNALPLLSVPNRQTFTYQISGNPVPATGSPLLFDGAERGYNGRFSLTVINPTTFTYPISSNPYPTAIGNPIVNANVRISGAVSIDRVKEAYTKQIQLNPKKLWAFVILGDTTVNKDRSILNDANYVAVAGTEFRQKEIQTFSIFVIIACTDEIAARASRDMMEDVRLAFYKALLGFIPPSELFDDTKFGITFLSHHLFEYSDAFYIHEFQFQIVSDITYGDLQQDFNVAFRDIDFYQNNSPNQIISTGVNLDDEPL